ncbi:fumarylacetoacetate hydrolase family protein [Thiomonas bhubaneswarensis]|uniref:2-keto-4-pentenoate hydratase/2-oxohepta-3-ene-1,7-dioic acid hydratase (Catechol pathway) n=1 Tax=Thiomonas bhubaneswarensis TaxID=339866 RepID=A0A0K6HTS4_9BURK|nr:fumarylacetoacetate hydrolase family protein [Thiomonas bhubaneswarensis]CUA94432.1 2-keto-4-pentenoate hydratase/2-oxohepta-3-ene-1,7-dioic acid hydratase (catechol pathway) [Thiomonas bhubaneswarensis]
MKFVRYGRNGQEQPGLIDAQGRLRSLSGQVNDIDASVFGPSGQKALRRLDPEQLPLVTGRPRLGVPFVGISKFIAIGLNYRDHANEAQMAIPTSPIVFNKWTTCISGPNDAVLRPPGAHKLDWEVELGVVIGRETRFVREADALRHVAGYCLVNDVSERAYQFEQGSQWNLGKGCDTFGPVGPWLVSADEIADPQDIDLWLEVNGERMQTGNTRDMIFGVAYLVAYLSRFMTLLPGDLIATGTPPGVGMGRKPPRYLQPGDVVTLGSPQLGTQRQEIRSAPQRVG